MQIYTATILNREARPTASDRMDCKSFKNFDSAVEYLMDFLVDSGFVDMDEVHEAEHLLYNNHVFVDTTNELEFRIDENELCNW